MKQIIPFFVIILIFTLLQILLAKRKKPRESIVLPLVYLLLSINHIINAFSLEVQLQPDYYRAAALFFPCIELIFVYFIFFYYWLYRQI